MDIFGVGVCAVCTVIFAALVKRSNKEYALLLAVSAGVLILLAVLRELGPLVAQLRDLTLGSSGGEYLSILLRAVGIALAGQLAANVCRDAGESALAFTVELAAKTSILAAALPLLFRILDCLEEILNL